MAQQPNKEGYEPSPGLAAAPAGYEAAPLLQPRFDQAPVPEPRRWNGHLLNCFGDCNLLGWSTCLITHYLPCVTFGITNRKAFGKSALRSGLIFASLVAVTYAHYAVQLSMLGNECLVDPSDAGDLDFVPRRMGPGFGTHDASTTHAHLRCAKPFGRAINHAKVHGDDKSDVCVKLMSASLGLNIMTILTFWALVVYGANLRSKMRAQYNIGGSKWRDFLAWWCCMPCAMCQEARTVAEIVPDGQELAPTAPSALPIYYAAAETTAPAVPVMSTGAAKPPKV